MIKAIETRFHGILFRSRIEARWAVFFTELNLPWQYEPEGFELKSKHYLPDFFLPRQKRWVEIKPAGFNENTDHLNELAEMTGYPVWLAIGSIPSFPPRSSWPENEMGSDFGRMQFEHGGEDYPYQWCRCTHCGEYGIQFDGRSERIACCPANNGHKDYTADEQTIVDAYAEARTKRFEHGDTDQWR